MTRDESFDPGVFAGRSRPDLRHVPGSDGLPIFGESFNFLRDPLRWTFDMHRRYGPVFRTYMFFEAGLNVSGADFAERFFLDKEQLFSSAYGWRNLLAEFFRNGLMLRDFADHRFHRGLIQAAFKRDALDSYLSILQPLFSSTVAGLQEGPLLAYPWLKRLTLDGAAAVFLGLEIGDDARRVSRWFTEVMAAVGSALRWDLPLTTYGRGLRARAELRRFFATLIPLRRAQGGTDMLSTLCRATNEQGERFSDDDIIDHIHFLLMAAHDTITSALTNMLFELGRRPELQAELREEARSVDMLDHDGIAKLQATHDCFREVLRLYPPVRGVPRRTLRETEIYGYRVPPNTQVWVNPDVVHRDPNIWREPDRFDPTRFREPRAEHKQHRFAFFPFGGGAHTCLGLQLSELQVKSFMHALLRRMEWRIAEGGARKMQYVPFVKPADDLPLVLANARM